MLREKALDGGWMYCRSRASEKEFMDVGDFLWVGLWIVYIAYRKPFTSTREVSDSSEWYWLWLNKLVPILAASRLRRAGTIRFKGLSHDM